MAMRKQALEVLRALQIAGTRGTTYRRSFATTVARRQTTPAAAPHAKPQSLAQVIDDTIVVSDTQWSGLITRPLDR